MRFLQKIKTFFKDARHFQIAYLASFLILGIVLLDWSNEWVKFLLIINVSILVQFIGTSLTNKNYSSWKSALITALGLCLLFKSNHLSTAMIGSAIAIASKFIIRVNGKHVFNPVNIGIILGILITQDAWISPGQWGSHFIILFVLGVLGFLVLKKVNRIDASLTFIIVFGGLQWIRSIFYLGWSPDVFFHQMTSGTLVLFTFFMITDPMTTPNNRTARIIWVTLISLVAFLMSNYLYVYAAPVWVLFFAAPLTPILDKFFIEKKFEWKYAKPIFNF